MSNHLKVTQKNCRKWVFLGIGFALTVANMTPSSGYPLEDRDLSDRVDRIMAPYDQDSIPGAAVVIVKDGQTILAKGYGLANVRDGEHATPETSFRLASLTKQFIALGIRILQEDGLLRLDQGIKEFIPEFPDYGRRISIRHLVFHQSGLSDYEDLIPTQQLTQISDADVLNLYVTKTKNTKFIPGSRYSYSNGGYVLLGLIIERLTGVSLESFLERKIFSPLGMRSIMYHGEATPIVSRAFGHSRKNNHWTRTDQSITSATRGDGGIYASVSDLALWSNSLELNSPSRIISNDGLREIFTPGRFNDGTPSQYGFGWVLDRYKGKRRRSHTGSSIGFRTAIQIYPDQNLTIAILTNRNSGEPWVLGEQIFESLHPN